MDVDHRTPGLPLNDYQMKLLAGQKGPLFYEDGAAIWNRRIYQTRPKKTDRHVSIVPIKRQGRAHWLWVRSHFSFMPNLDDSPYAELLTDVKEQFNKWLARQDLLSNQV